VSRLWQVLSQMQQVLKQMQSQMQVLMQQNQKFRVQSIYDGVSSSIISVGQNFIFFVPAKSISERNIQSPLIVCFFFLTVSVWCLPRRSVLPFPLLAFSESCLELSTALYNTVGTLIITICHVTQENC
jgi:hypothetical protein